MLPLLLGLSIAILASVVLSACIGVAGSSLSAVWESLTNFDPNSTVHQVIRELRLPRAVGAVLIGAALALSGAIMQGIGNNPLADTGLLGINAGAGFLVSISMAVFSAISFHWVMACAFLGACLGAVLTYGFGTAKGRNTAPLRLLLAGSAVSALFNAISQGISLCFGLAKDLSFWQSGSLSGLTWNQIYIAIPWMLLAMVAGLLLGPVLSILALGQESATGLGGFCKVCPDIRDDYFSYFGRELCGNCGRNFFCGSYGSAYCPFSCRHGLPKNFASILVKRFPSHGLGRC